MIYGWMMKIFDFLSQDHPQTKIMHKTDKLSNQVYEILELPDLEAFLLRGDQ